MKFIRYCVLLSLLLVNNTFAKDITINFQNTPIEDVIKFIAAKHKKNILINERISGNVNFLSNKPIDDSELLTLLEHILSVKGYALSPSAKGYYEIVRATKASKEVTFGENNEVGMEMVVLRPQYIKPSIVSAKVKHLASPYSVITHDDKMGLLLISDYPKNIRNVKKLLTLFDTHLKRDVQRIKLKHYQVKTAFPKLKSIFDITKDDYKSEIKLISDEYQNTIWISANSDDMEKALSFIKAFDVQAENSATMKTKIIFLKNANADDIVKTAQEIAKSRDKDKPIKSVITSNKELNALVISSTNAQIKELSELIEQLDIERRQVFVKVQIYEVSQNAIDSAGIKWGLAGGYADDISVLTSSVNMGGSFMALPPALASTIALDSTNKGLALGATIDLLKSEGGVNTISEPNLLSVNNKKSTIYVGKTQSILTSSSTGSNADDTTRNSYTREDIGMTLEITPQIADKDKVVLKILANVEDVDAASGATADKPTTTKRKVETNAIVQNEESIILGGMIRDNFSSSQSKVPLLGDIPFLGKLFRHESEVHDKITLIIIITPYIINNSKELQEMQEKLARLDRAKKQLSMKMRTILELDKKTQKSESEQLEIINNLYENN